jgi:hypothetical protein
MPPIQTGLVQDGVPIIRLESEHLIVEVAPEVGGRIISLRHKRSGHEFLWRNAALPLTRSPSGSEYDPNFYGGIDELLPNDLPEQIDGATYPDHGELWTTSLHSQAQQDHLVLTGTLTRSGLSYRREMHLHPGAPCLDLAYTITNSSPTDRSFLWKLHAALAIAPGDAIDCPARLGQVVDPAWSRFHSTEPFLWPRIEDQNASVIPERNGTMDFFYLSELSAGWVAWRRPSAGLTFAYEFDRSVFPYVWLFASYGGFLNHYTAILEPCTAMPLSLREAARLNQCSRLAPGASLQTRVILWAGHDNEVTGPAQHPPVIL